MARLRRAAMARGSAPVRMRGRLRRSLCRAHGGACADAPMPADAAGDLGGVGLVGGQADDRTDAFEGDHASGRLQRGGQGLDCGDLVALGVRFPLGEDRAGLVHRGQQVDLGAVGAAGAAHGLAVHRESGRGRVRLPRDRSAGQAPIAASSASPSTLWSTRRTVASAGAAGPMSGSRHDPPRRISRSGGASTAPRAIAASEQASAMTAHAAKATTNTGGWRQPRLQRGAGTTVRGASSQANSPDKGGATPTSWPMPSGAYGLGAVSAAFAAARAAGTQFWSTSDRRRQLGAPLSGRDACRTEPTRG